MKKMLVIDDEYLVRLGIKETIDWSQYNIEIVGEATNGQKGFELAVKLQPDIIISDIRMPIMDGLVLMKSIQKSELDTIVIMLSGYKDFEYAKETLESGAFQYLLKPIDNQKLIECVLKAANELDKRREKKAKLAHITLDLPLITTTFIQTILSGQLTDETEILARIHNYNINFPMEGTIVFVQMDDEVINSKNQTCDDFNYLEGLINQKLEKAGYKYIYLKYSTHLVYLIELIKQELLIDILESVIEQFEKKAKSIISLGISNPYNKLNDLTAAYQDAKNNAKSKLFLTINTITTNNNHQLNYHKTVVEGLRYISKNYQKNISIGTCCDALKVSESHLMHMFKEDLGKTFNESLTDYRMKIAKKLLMMKQYKIYEVSYLIGFNDHKYFSQVFKKTYGITPGEYINMIGNSDEKEI